MLGPHGSCVERGIGEAMEREERARQGDCIHQSNNKQPEAIAITSG